MVVGVVAAVADAADDTGAAKRPRNTTAEIGEDNRKRWPQKLNMGLTVHLTYSKLQHRVTIQ